MNKESTKVLTFFAISLTIVTVGGALWLLGTLLGEGIWLLAKRNSDSTAVQLNPMERSNAKVELNLVGNGSFSGYSIFRHPEFKRMLAREYGMNLNYQEEYDQNKKVRMINRGRADIWMTTLDRYLEEKPEGKIVGVIGRSIGADAIILNNKKYPNLESIEDLESLIAAERQQNNRLGITYTRDTSSEYLALVLSSKFEEFNLPDFRTKETRTSVDAWEAFKNQRENVAVAVMWEPYVSIAKKEGYQTILSSKDTPESLVHIIVASDRVLERNPEKVSQFLEAYYAQIDNNVRQPSQLREYIATESQLSIEEAESVLAGIDFFTATKAKKWMSDGSIEKHIDSIASTLVTTKRLDRIPQSFQQLFASDYLDRAASNTDRLIAQVRGEDPQLAERLAGVGQTIAVKSHTGEEHHHHEEHNHTHQEHNHSHEEHNHSHEGHNHSEEEYIIIGGEKFASEEEHREKHQHLDEFKTTKVGGLKWNGKISFEYASSQLDDRSAHVLEHVAEKISELNPETIAIRVIGHTSRSGTVQGNQILSKQRAQVVIDALQARGLKHKFIAEGKGYSDPLPEYPPEDIKQQRTEIIVERIEK